MDTTEKMLKELTEASGVSGYEREIRDVIRRYLKPTGQLSQDKLGSLICKKKGTSDGPRVVLAGHMDEVGFMVKYITDDGFIRFTPLGGWWDQVLLAQRVVIKTTKGDVIGIIGAKPPHVMNAEERKKLVEKKEMYIDIGASSRGEVDKAGVTVGDPIVPFSEFAILANGKTYLAKAFDDRIGCAMVISVLQHLNDGKHPNTVYGIATAQEEVGSRGAKTSIDTINPDVALILEVEISGDVPGIKPEEAPVKMGKGPSLLAYDAGMIPNLKLRDLIIDTARKNKINLQIAAMEGGGTDGDIIHLHRSGVPTVVLSVPTRHIHSHSSIINRQDFDDTVKLAVALVRRLNGKVVAGLCE
jgi:putative aminopeptidase FrvX